MKHDDDNNETKNKAYKIVITPLKGNPKTTNLDSHMQGMEMKANFLTSIMMTQDQMAQINMMTTGSNRQDQMSKVSESAREQNGRDLYITIYTAYIQLIYTPM